MAESGEPPSSGLTADPDIQRVEALLISRLSGAPPEWPRIDRYEIVEELGRGGMGVVYAARDKSLGRSVAIKLLHRDNDTEIVRRRLRREAQAMARVDHDNVARVFEIGLYRGRVFVVMELVEGCTLRKWIASAPSSSEVLERYLQAGRALAAAHALDVVHRDFKPDNVMLGNDGRVRVLDFGLARAGPITLQGVDEPIADTNALAAPLTRTGALLGTPAYMAPEQFRGEQATEAADQFAFCVSLFEALYGARPFAGDTAGAVYESAMAGRIETPETSTVPPHVLVALRRGLAAQPSARWPRMAELLAALRRRPGRARRLALATLVAAAIVGVAAGGVRLQRAAARSAAIESCAFAADSAPFWNDDARTRIREGLVATTASFATATLDRIIPELDAYATRWSEHRRNACLATRIEGTASAAELDRALWCLDDRRLAFEALLEQLAIADTQTAALAIAAVASLPRVESCGDAELLARLPELPSERTEAIREVRATMARTAALEHAGRYAEAIDAARSDVDAGAELGWPPLTAAARAQLGRALDREGRYPEAEAELSAAYFEAIDAGALEVAIDASLELVRTCGVHQMRPEVALGWSRHAEAAITLLGGDDEALATARRLQLLAELYVAKVEVSEAERLAARALEIREQILGAAHPDTGESAYMLAFTVEWRDHTAARPHARRALAIAERALGPEHPDMVSRLLLLADIAVGQWGIVLTTHARGIAERALGPENPLVAQALLKLARDLYWAESPQVAEPMIRRALAIQAATIGTSHPDYARALNLLGMVYHPGPKAEALYQQALAIAEQNVAPGHPAIAYPLYNLAEIRQLEGDYDGAMTLLERGFAERTRAYGPNSSQSIAFAARLGQVEICRGRYAAAHQHFVPLPHSWPWPYADTLHHHLLMFRLTEAESDLAGGNAEHALEIVNSLRERAASRDSDAREFAPWTLWADFVLARALWDAAPDRGRDRARARRVARALTRQLRTVGLSLPATQCSTPQRELTRVEQWLETH